MSKPKRGITALLFAAAATVAFVSDAAAGRRAFMFTWDTEALNKGDVEIEQWLWARGLQENGNTAGWLWFSPIYGLTDHVELAFPWEIVTTPAGTRMTNFTAEARIRLYDANDEERFVRNLIRVFYQQNFNHPENAGMPAFTPWAGLNFVTSLGDIKGSHFTLDVGGHMAMHFISGNYLVRQTVGAGYTHQVHDEWRISAEYFHELQFGGAQATQRPDGSASHHFYLGPGVGFTRGRVWLTLGALIGLTPATPRVMPRLLFAVAI